MSRVIKFRIWEAWNHRMRYWDDMEKTRLQIVNWKNECHPDNKSEFDIMQFTGLLDKNGKEVYEGDILKHGGWCGEVSWRDEIGGWSKGLGGHHDDDGLTRYEAKMCEIIGNIYENPELLEEK